jgi:hypothetical protein
MRTSAGACFAAALCHLTSCCAIVLLLLLLLVLVLVLLA